MEAVEPTANSLSDTLPDRTSRGNRGGRGLAQRARRAKWVRGGRMGGNESPAGHSQTMERHLIRHLRGAFPPHPALSVPVGDDAAVLAVGRPAAWSRSICSWTASISTRASATPPRRAASAGRESQRPGRHGGRPIAAVVSLALPRGGGWNWATELYEGLSRWRRIRDLAGGRRHQ